VYLLSQPLPHCPLPIIELHSPIPPPILTGAPLFIAAVKNLRKPWLLPDIPKDSIVAFTSAVTGNSGEVIYVGVGKVASEGGVRGAVERRAKVLDEGVDKDEGKFCDILCIVGDQ
jgi:translation initiation factor 2D